jgi:hypothetical protein
MNNDQYNLAFKCLYVYDCLISDPFVILVDGARSKDICSEATNIDVTVKLSWSPTSLFFPASVYVSDFSVFS